MDVKTKRREAEEMMKSPPAGTFNEMNKSCIDCHTTRTPLWRGGPAGPRSLCNACGIRYRKTKKLALLGRDKGRAQKRKRKYSSNNNNNNNNNKGATKLGISLKAGLMAVGSDMGEEEQAAILLMSLSYGCLYA